LDNARTPPNEGVETDRLTSVYRLLVEASADMVAVLDLDGVYILANRAYRDFHGVEGDISGQTVRDILGSALWETEIRPQIKRCAESGSARFRSHRHHPTLGPKVLETAYDRIEESDADGLIVAVLRDITREVQEDHHYRLLFQSSRTGLAIIDRDGRILDTNPALAEIVGRSRDELNTLPVSDIMPEDAFREADEVAQRRVFAAPHAAEWDSVLLHASGGRRHVQVTAWLVRSGQEDAGRMMLQVRDLTELRESESRYRRVVENAQEGIWVIDENAVTVYANPSIGRMLGYDHRKMVGCPLFAFFDEELEPAVRGRLQRQADGASIQFDFTFNHASGHRVFTTMAVSPVFDTNRDYRGAIAGIIDVTELRASRAQSEAIRLLSELFLSQRSLDQILRETPALLAGALGYPTAAVEEFVPDEDALVFRGAVGIPEFRTGDFRVDASVSPSGEVARTGRPLAETDFAARWRVPDPRLEGVSPTSFICAPIPGEAESFGVITMADPKPRADLSSEIAALEIIAKHLGAEIARRRAVEELRESERSYTSLVSNLSGMVYRCANAQGWPMTLLEGSVEDITGHRAENLRVGGVLSFGDIIADEDRETVWSTVQTALERKQPYEIEYRITRSDGSSRWLWEQGAGVFDEHGALRFLEGYITDVTQRRIAEEQLSESEARFRRLVQNARDMIIRVRLRPDVVYEFVSDSAMEMTGYSPEEFYADRNPAFSHCHPDDAQVLRRIVEDPESIPPNPLIIRFMHRDGHWVWTEQRPVPIRNDDGEIVGLESILRDITVERELEEQLRQAQKLESIGQLAGGVAHDFNNILQSMFGDVELAEVARADGGDVTPHLQSILKNTERAARLTNQLLALGRRQRLTLQRLDLNRVIHEHSSMVRRLIGEHIQLDVDSSVAVAVQADRGQLEQVLLNLVINARDAMPDGGGLTIRSNRREVGHDEASMLGLAEPGWYASLEVQDTGFGIPEEIRDRIFEPFFTTKPAGQGTGLGLATAYGIIRQHGGVMTVRSVTGRGSVFEILLPSADQADDTPDIDREPVPAGGTETILVAEDEDSVRSVLVQVMRESGYSVLEACDGIEAIELFDRDPGGVDLAVLDAVMPRAGGREVYEHIHAVRPDIPILFSSGYDTGTVHTRFVLDEGLELLQKPYPMATLLNRIRALLDG
jgi:two-component system cell cycle sensor histidine kinase/response regulator CckA